MSPERFRAIGLAPAGDDGSYFQQVPLLKAGRGPPKVARFVIKREGKSTGG